MKLLSAKRSGRKPRGFLANSAILSVTMLGVSAGNYVLNLVMARLLSPAEFGDANLAINIVLAAAAVAATFQLVTSKAVAAQTGGREHLRHVLVRRARTIGGIFAASFVVAAWALADALRTSTPWLFVIIGIGLPFYFSQAVDRGVLQGDLRIPRLAGSYVIESLVRVLGAVALVLMGLGVVGASIAISASFVASGMVARKRYRSTQPVDSTVVVDRSTLRPVATSAAVLLVGQVIINNGDVVLSKAFFDPELAGVYAVAALIGRSVFFFSWSVVHAVFPLAASKSLCDKERRTAVHQAMALIVGLGLAGMLVVARFGDEIVLVLFGDGYRGAVELIMPYVFASTIFAVANLISSVSLALGRTAAPLILLLGSLLQTGLLVVMGGTPMGMVRAQIVAMTCTLLGVSLARGSGHWQGSFDERRRAVARGGTVPAGEHVSSNAVFRTLIGEKGHEILSASRGSDCCRVGPHGLRRGICH